MTARNCIMLLFFVLLACAFPVSAAQNNYWQQQQWQQQQQMQQRQMQQQQEMMRRQQEQMRQQQQMQQQQQRILQQQRARQASEQARAAQQRAIRDQDKRRQFSQRQNMAQKLQQQKAMEQNNRLKTQRRLTQQRLVQQKKLQKNRQERERKNSDIGALALIGLAPKTSMSPQLSERIRNVTRKSANDNNPTKVSAGNTGYINRPSGKKSGNGDSGRPSFKLTKVFNRSAKPLSKDVASRLDSVTKGPIYVAPEGIAVTSKTLAKQGTSHLAGDFRGLAGSSVDDIISRVPKGWKMVPQDRGAGIKFLDAQGFERIRLHGLSARAPAGSNSASGWTMRIMDRAGNYYDNAGNVVPYRANTGHIPIRGNPTNAP